MTSALIGASRPEQVIDAVAALDKLDFSADELKEIDRHAVDAGINLWARSAELRHQAALEQQPTPFVATTAGRAKIEGRRAGMARGRGEAP